MSDPKNEIFKRAMPQDNRSRRGQGLSFNDAEVCLLELWNDWN
jgi:hypothetical protein